MRFASPEQPLRRLFAGLTEHAFIDTLGVADPPMVDYVSDMLARFIHFDAVFRLKNADGRTIDEPAAMVMEAEGLPAEGRTRREFRRHIGDFTLFWTGLFPEEVRRRSTGYARDSFVSYTLVGKRAYLAAGSYDDDELKEESAVLTRIGHEFELCTVGLNRVRKELEEVHIEYEGGRLIGG